MTRLRIAPTPSGFLHEGNRHNFRLISTLREELGASLLLRIDDLDYERTRQEYIQHIFDVLVEENIQWDIGPNDSADFQAHWSQHHRMDEYHDLLSRLREEGHLFACACSRSEWKGFERIGCPRGCHHKNMHLDTPDVTWRLRMDAPVAEPGLTILRQRNGMPAYHIASLSDDVRFGITHIVRGEDLRTSTELQLDIARRLNLSTFLNADIRHHELILGADGKKLSKSG